MLLGFIFKQVDPVPHYSNHAYKALAHIFIMM